MKTVFPHYYPQFSCIAEKCRHNCCIGWEIDIDEDTLFYYQGIEGAFGKRLKQNIALDEEKAHFILGEKERCPFLAADNLCDIYRNLGEDALCQICSDHPRFVHEWENFDEIGLGLCCEEAARLVLSDTEIFHLLGEANIMLTEEEKEIFLLRKKMMELMQDKNCSLADRIKKLLSLADAKEMMPEKQVLFDIFLHLERLDPAWDKMLIRWKAAKEMPYTIEQEAAFERLICYFLFRYLPDAVYDGMLAARTAFCILCTRMILSVYTASEDNSFAGLIDTVRMFSSEIEYDEENVNALLELCQNAQNS